MNSRSAIADASPICYLILIGEIELLPHLFAKVLIPRQMLEELRVAGAPLAVRSWAAATPAWISIHDVQSDLQPIPRLQAGEQAAIALALSANADVILLDEKSARRFASERGLKIAGILSVLAEAGDLGLVDLATVFDKLAKTNFRYSPGLLKLILEGFLRP